MRRKKGNKTELLLAAALLLLLTALAAGAAVWNSYRNYQEKIEIISALTTLEEPETQNTAIRLLREGTKGEAGTEGLWTLEKYGYLEQSANYYGLRLQREVRGILAGALGCFLAGLLVHFFIQLRWRRRKEAELLEISALAEQFQKRNYKVEESLEAGSAESTRERIRGQFRSLGEMLAFQEERQQEEKEETKSLVTDISHQLKTPVAALKACFEVLLQENLDSQEQEEFSARCRKQLEGLENLLEALLNISRMESGMIQVKKEEEDIFETLATAVSRVYTKAQTKEISIELESMEEDIQGGGAHAPESADSKPGDEEDPGSYSAVQIPHDRKWTCEAFINILENAVKYGTPGSTIRIRMQSRQTFLRIEFENEGVGIPKKEYHKIFQRFYRGQSARVQQEEGSGVGLYLTRQILSRQGGTITVSSQTQGGAARTTFVIQLPWQE